MNLYERNKLFESRRAISSDPVVTRLAEYLSKWKQDDKTAEELSSGTERFLGNSWIQNAEAHRQVYELWAEFRDHNIKGIGGMTMNERLYWFGLFERYDACEDEQSRLVVYKKLHATL